MNHDEGNPQLPPEAGAGIEARIVAWVAGEASPFEVAELERLVAEKPDLAVFKRRIETVSGLVADAVGPEKTPLRLSPARRAQVFHAIGAREDTAPAAPAGSPVYLSPAAMRRKHQKEFRWVLAVAACLAVAFIVGVALVPSFQEVRPRWMLAKGFGSEAISATRSERKADIAKEQSSGQPAREDADDAVDLPAIAPEGGANNLPAVGAPTGGGTTSAPAVAFGAMAPPAPAGDYGREVRLAPFTVEAPQEQGYMAESTLAGTRVQSNLRDLASGISVTTRQFLGDIGSTTGGTGHYGTGASPRRSSAEEWDARVGDFGQASVNIDAVHLEKENPNGALLAYAGKSDRAGQDEAGDRDQIITLSPFEVASVGNKTHRATTRTFGPPEFYVPPVDLAMAGAANGKGAGPGEPATPEAAAAVQPAAPPEDFSAETDAAKDPVSTFSLHVSDVSFRLAQAALARGERPDPDGIRPEEFYNAFDYGDPAPVAGEPVACRIEQAAHPFLQQRNLVRIAMKVPATGRGAGQPLNLTVLLDTSGSMEREDRAAAVRRAFRVLVSLLGPNDRITLIGFARRPRLLAESVPGDQAAPLVGIVTRTPAEGGTNFEEALKLGGELARRHFAAPAQNRVVLLTDGAANLGDADPAQLALRIDDLRQQGIAFDACGVGTDGIDDAMLEALTRKGGGRYYVLDTPEAADAGFARQLAGAFRPAAENVKVQVRFNPARVGRYRLIGFEHHRLRAEDFRNDKVPAAELAAEESAVALYQVEVLPQGDGELGEVYVRFLNPATHAMVERSWTMPYDPGAPAFDQAAPPMQLAGTAALLAEKLRGGGTAPEIRLDALAPVVNALRARYEHEARVQELAQMFEQMRRLRLE